MKWISMVNGWFSVVDFNQLVMGLEVLDWVDFLWGWSTWWDRHPHFRIKSSSKVISCRPRLTSNNNTTWIWVLYDPVTCRQRWPWKSCSSIYLLFFSTVFWWEFIFISSLALNTFLFWYHRQHISRLNLNIV